MGAGFVAAGKADLVGHTVEGRRCNWVEELHTTLEVGRRLESQRVAAIVDVSSCQRLAVWVTYKRSRAVTNAWALISEAGTHWRGVPTADARSLLRSLLRLVLRQSLLHI